MSPAASGSPKVASPNRKLESNRDFSLPKPPLIRHHHPQHMDRKPAYRTSRTAAMLVAAAAAMPVIITHATAQDGAGGMSGLAQREMIRRQGAVRQADEALVAGRKAYTEGDYDKAVTEYKRALDILPEAPMLADRRTEFLAHLADASVALAQKNRKVGKYKEARAVLDEVIKADPENVLAKREIGYLDDPIRTNQALNYEHTKNIDKVRRGLYTGEGFFNLGKYDDAKREYEKVLRVDPFNKAARRGMERAAAAKSDYYRAAYDHTRAELLSQVDQAWELAVPNDAPTGSDQFIVGPMDNAGASYILRKLSTIVVPVVDFQDISVDEAVDFLRQRSVELDTLELDPARKGVNFVIRKPKTGGAAPGGGEAGAPAEPSTLGAGPEIGTLRINELRLRNVPLATALKYVCDAANLRYRVDEFAVNIVPLTDSGDELYNRTFRVAPDFVSKLSEGGESAAGGAAPTDPFAEPTGGAKGGGGSGGNVIQPRKPVQDLLKIKGIPFPEGASASMVSGNLVVRNTPSNLDLIEQIVQADINTIPKQIKIVTKFVEITQENTDELSFDWIVSPFGLTANSLFASGGTVGSGIARTNTDFVSPINGVRIPGIPTAASQNVTDIATAGLRSGDAAVTRDSIEALLNNPNRSTQQNHVAPGVLSLTGLFSDGTVQMIMRGLAQKKGADIMTAPSVTARSGQKATIEIIREFIYPTEYEQPQIPNTFGGNGNNNNGGGIGGIGGGGGQVASSPITPATPTAFETRNTGVTLEIEPTIGNNDYLIDLRFAPEIVEFEGFVNYGSPIQAPATDALGNPTTVTITDNRIEMPVFSTRKVNTGLTIYDGYTVAVGGLISEKVQNVEDKIPILGDIPIIGRLFQSKAENHIKSNLIIFVTAQIIDATGQPLRHSAAEPLALAPPKGEAAAAAAAGPGVLPPLPEQ